ncbi:hypothetical protein FXW78_49545 [Rhodococcus opacus]|nr:hypothetical protein [Rhodococcus opacus]
MRRAACNVPGSWALRRDPGPARRESDPDEERGRRRLAAHETRASNLWMVGADKTTDGTSVLMNGPQFGWFNPSYVYGVACTAPVSTSR